MSPIKPIKIQLYRIVFWQLMMIMGLAVLFILLKGLGQGLAVFLGGLTYWLPTFIFMLRMAAYASARTLHFFMVAFFAGETIKLILSATLFILFVKYLSIGLLYAVIGLVGAIIAFWIAAFSSLYKKGVKA